MEGRSLTPVGCVSWNFVQIGRQGETVWLIIYETKNLEVVLRIVTGIQGDHLQV